MKTNAIAPCLGNDGLVLAINVLHIVRMREVHERDETKVQQQNALDSSYLVQAPGLENVKLIRVLAKDY